MNTEDSVDNTTINITKAESTAVKEVKEETEETEDPLRVAPGWWFYWYGEERGRGDNKNRFFS